MGFAAHTATEDGGAFLNLLGVYLLGVTNAFALTLHFAAQTATADDGAVFLNLPGTSCLSQRLS